MRTFLLIVFSAILASMIVVTTIASLDRGVFQVGPQLLSDPWFHATLADAYFGFLTFYLWVAYKERRLWGRIVWFVLIMTLGNIAMSVYVLIRLARMRPGEGMRELLLRDNAPDLIPRCSPISMIKSNPF